MASIPLLKSTKQAAIFSLLLSATVVYGQTANDPTPKDSQIRENSPSVQNERNKAGSNQADPLGTLSRADQKVMYGLVFANLAEIEAARLAQTKSQNPQVKQFAQQMIEDHSKLQQELKQLAQNKGGIPLPDRPNEKHQEMLKQLADLPPEQFDQRYMQHSGITDHKKTHQFLQDAEKKAKDPDLKALVKNTTPIVKQHLQMAKGKLKEPGKESAGSSMSGGAAAGTGQ